MSPEPKLFGHGLGPGPIVDALDPPFDTKTLVDSLDFRHGSPPVCLFPDTKFLEQAIQNFLPGNNAEKLFQSGLRGSKMRCRNLRRQPSVQSGMKSAQLFLGPPNRLCVAPTSQNGNITPQMDKTPEHQCWENLP
jgi:hypothetical protein